MRLIDADALYEKTAEWEAQALHMVEVTMHDEDKTEWRRWSAVLTERSAFKHDIADAPTIVEFEGDINKVIVKGEEYHKIVRCKDCKYWHREIHNGIEYFNFSSCDLNHHGDGHNFYCADAERRTG